MRIYTDGSCWPRRSIGEPRAGYAVVAIHEAGDIVAVGFGRVPPRLPQTAAAAEAWAFHRAACLMGNVLVVSTDNAAVVSNAVYREWHDPRNLLSGLFRSLRSRLSDGTLTARKV